MRQGALAAVAREELREVEALAEAQRAAGGGVRARVADEAQPSSKEPSLAELEAEAEASAKAKALPGSEQPQLDKPADAGPGGAG
jgi:hypothetical protein